MTYLCLGKTMKFIQCTEFTCGHRESYEVSEKSFNVVRFHAVYPPVTVKGCRQVTVIARMPCEDCSRSQLAPTATLDCKCKCSECGCVFGSGREIDQGGKDVPMLLAGWELEHFLKDGCWGRVDVSDLPGKSFAPKAEILDPQG